ncbi:MAG: hypothetical protein ABSD71_11680, partial [Bacteroidales bacterium]
IIPGDDIENVEDIGRRQLKEYLHVLSFVTNMSFKIHKLNRIIDWTQGTTERRCLQFQLFPGDELPKAILKEEHFRSLELLQNAKVSIAFKRALKWFSNGIGATSLDDQFEYFWLTIELLAQIHKEPDKVSDECPKCKSPLYCEKCKTYPVHRPYPKQSIKKLIDGITAFNTTGLFEDANEIRNAIMHGKDVDETCKNLNVEMVDVVDALGKVAWISIFNNFIHEIPEHLKAKQFQLLSTNKYSHHLLNVKVNLAFKSKDPDHPKLSECGKFKISVSRL